MDPLYIIYTLFDIQVIFGLFNNSTIQHVLRNPKERERKNNVANIIFLKRRYVVRYSLSFLNWDRVESWWLAKSRFCGHKILHALWWGMDRLRLSLVYSILVLMSLSHPWPRAKEEIQGSGFVCRRKWQPVGSDFRRQTKRDPCKLPIFIWEDAAAQDVGP